MLHGAQAGAASQEAWGALVCRAMWPAAASQRAQCVHVLPAQPRVPVCMSCTCVRRYSEITPAVSPLAPIKLRHQRAVHSGRGAPPCTDAAAGPAAAAADAAAVHTATGLAAGREVLISAGLPAAAGAAAAAPVAPHARTHLPSSTSPSMLGPWGTYNTLFCDQASLDALLHIGTALRRSLRSSVLPLCSAHHASSHAATPHPAGAPLPRDRQ